MSAAVSSVVDRRRWAADWLERVGGLLDLTEAQIERAKGHYEAVGRWLGTSDHPWLAQSSIYVHGSIGLGTAKRPFQEAEFDVDLIQWLHHGSASSSPAEVKALVGDRLREHGTYAPMLEEVPRCWRLNYANQFHLDITVGVPHPVDPAPALFIPDRRLRCWVPTNPKGFRELFERRAALRPALLTLDKAMRADVADFPLHDGPKGALRRLVQLLKHHRDVAFRDPEVASLQPISIVITALASRAYESIVRSGRLFDNDYDLLLAVVRCMPTFIEYDPASAQPYRVMNETVKGENFAEKWNKDGRLARSFYEWHEKAVLAFESIAQLQGQDQIAKRTSAEFGAGVGERVLTELNNELTQRRATGRLGVHGGLGLIARNAPSVIPVRTNTFFGRP